MPRYYPPEKIPIEKLLKLARELRVVVDEISANAQAISETDFKEPWVFYVDNAEGALRALQNFNVALYGQKTKMRSGDSGAPKEPVKHELSESTQKTLKAAKKALRPRKKPPEKRNP
jgi:hypothetical protein